MLLTPNMALRSGSLNLKGMLETWRRLACVADPGGFCSRGTSALDVVGGAPLVPTFAVPFCCWLLSPSPSVCCEQIEGLINSVIYNKTHNKMSYNKQLSLITTQVYFSRHYYYYFIYLTMNNTSSNRIRTLVVRIYQLKTLNKHKLSSPLSTSR